MQKKYHSLKHSSMVTFILSFIIPSFLLTSILFIFFIGEITKTQKKEYENTLSLLSSHLVNHIDANSGLSLSYIYDTKITGLCNFLNRNDYEDVVSKTDNKIYYRYTRLVDDYTSSLNTRMTLLNDSILGIGFIPHTNNADKLFYLSKYSTVEVNEFTNYKASDWYTQLQTNNQNPVFVLSDTNDTKHSISLVRTMKDIDRQRIIGYFILDLSLDYILESLNDIAISKYSGIIVKSPNEALLYSTSRDVEQFSPLLTPTSNTDLIPKYDTYSFTDESYGFTFYYLSSKFTLTEKLRSAAILVLSFYVVMSLLAAVLWTLTSRNTRRSISPILHTMAKYQAGNSSIVCNTSDCTIAEFRTIADNLNDMLLKINTYIDNEYKFKIAQKEAEYKALQSEINPHFLHNVLNLLVGLNRIGDKSGLEQSIISLSHMFRYICEHNYNSSLKQEFDFIEDYLYLQQIRYEERLNFRVYLEEDLWNFSIPKLLIQPLVENAIVHGLEPSNQCEYIHLSAITCESKNKMKFVCITVINSGLPYIENKSYKRVGIQNIEERLSIFSPNSFFSIRGNKDKPTKCTIILPM